MVKPVNNDQLRSLLSDYQKEGELLKRHEEVLIKFIKSIGESAYFYDKKDFSKKEKKLFLRMLMEFGEIDDSSDIPLGRALQLGYGSRVQLLIRQFIPRWKRWLKWWISFGLSCLFIGLLTKWLLHSFALGVFTAIILRVIYESIRFIPATYFQNEILIRRRNHPKKEKH